MKSVGARVAAAVLLLCLTSRHAVADTCVDVHLRFNEGQPPAALVESLKREAAAIWKVYGVDLQWGSSACLAAVRPMSFEVLLDQHQRASGGHEVLGDARMSQALIDHVPIRLDREATETLLRSVTFEQVARLAGHASVGLVDVGVALGRVLAHELGHVLLATRGHQPRGLMRPAFSGEELLTAARETYGLSEPEVVRLRHEIRRHSEVERAGRHTEGGSET